MGTATVPLVGEATVGLAVNAHAEAVRSLATFDDVTVELGPGGPTPPGPLPAPWAGDDVGAPTVAGTSGHDAGTFTVRGAGDDVWAGADQFHFVHQALAGDGTITARLATQEAVDAWSKAGLMVKQSTATGSSYAFLAVTPGHGVHLQSDFTSDQLGPPTGTAPLWLRLTRTGASVSAATSPDGVTWTPVGTAATSLAGPVEVGLAATSHNGGVAGTATFDGVVVDPAPGPVPTPWVAADVGAPALAGSAGYEDGVFTVTGAGTDVWAEADQFHFVHQTLAGDGSVTARVVAQTPADEWSKAGVMIKQSDVAGAAYAFLAVTPDHGVRFQHGFTGSLDGPAPTTLPLWVRLTRAGTSVTAATSVDGVTWTPVGTAEVALSGSVEVGLAVTSHDAGERSTATFDGVSVG